VGATPTLALIVLLALATSSCAFVGRASVDTAGNQANLLSLDPSISADGRYVAFESAATNLVVGDTNNSRDVFVHDTVARTTTRVSVDSNGNQAINPGVTFSPSISGDGSRVAFASDASNLVAVDTNNRRDVFVHNRKTGTTTRVSVDSLGDQANHDSFNPVISADGRFVAFDSFASDLAPGDTNNTTDVFLHDCVAATTARVSVDGMGNQANSSSQNSSISADGRFVAFDSAASNLVPGDTNSREDVFVRDTATGTTVRVSIGSGGIQTNNHSFAPSMSGSGRYVAFQSDASNLVAGDTNSRTDVFLRDTATGTTTRVSVDNAGNQSDGASIFPSIAGDGRYVAFSSFATNLVTDDTNGVQDVFVHDTLAGTTARSSLDATDHEANGDSHRPSLSGDGRSVAFDSSASNLIGNDTNNSRDVLVRANPAPVVSELAPGTLARGTTTPVTITGSGFVDGAVVFAAPVEGVSFANVIVVAPGEILADATVAADAPVGMRHVLVHQAGTGVASATGICLSCLTLT
jgi:Tol biopolymer transport system component